MYIYIYYIHNKIYKHDIHPEWFDSELLSNYFGDGRVLEIMKTHFPIRQKHRGTIYMSKMVLPSATPPRSSKCIAPVQKPDEENYVSSLLVGGQTIVQKKKHSKPWLCC